MYKTVKESRRERKSLGRVLNLTTSLPRREEI
jgi:hypothetical protein